MAETASRRLLIVDDEPDVRAFIQRVAEDCGFAVREASSAASFADQLAAFDPDTVILDLAMPETDGIELLDVVARKKPTAGILIISGFDPTIVEVARSLGEAKGLQMIGAVTKPVRVATLRQLLGAGQPQAAAPGAAPSD